MPRMNAEFFIGIKPKWGRKEVIRREGAFSASYFPFGDPVAGRHRSQRGTCAVQRVEISRAVLSTVDTDGMRAKTKRVPPV